MQLATTNFPDIGNSTTVYGSFLSFIIIFPCGLTAENLANSSFNQTSLVLKGAQFLKFIMLPVLLVSNTFHSYFSFLVSVVNCKFGCSKFAARSTLSGSPFTVLTISST